MQPLETLGANLPDHAMEKTEFGYKLTPPTGAIVDIAGVMTEGALSEFAARDRTTNYTNAASMGSHAIRSAFMRWSRVIHAEQGQGRLFFPKGQEEDNRASWEAAKLDMVYSEFPNQNVETFCLGNRGPWLFTHGPTFSSVQTAIMHHRLQEIYGLGPGAEEVMAKYIAQAAQTNPITTS